MATHLDFFDQPLELLRRVNPIPNPPISAGVDEALGEVARAITGQPYETAHRRHALRRWGSRARVIPARSAARAATTPSLGRAVAT